VSKLLIAPHTDDESLFCAFTIMREKPLVLIVFDSYVQVARGHTNCTAKTRSTETIKALHELSPASSAHRLVFLGLRDDDLNPLHYIKEKLRAIASTQIEEIYYPAFEQDGHDQHNAVALAVEAEFTGLCRLTSYLTYTRTHGKSRSNKPVPYTPDMIARKHRALACYTSQMDPATGCDSWFMGDMMEYYQS
jgi:LmbE family N-acetylglucosaminyl deacetylase